MEVHILEVVLTQLIQILLYISVAIMVSKVLLLFVGLIIGLRSKCVEESPTLIANAVVGLVIELPILIIMLVLMYRFKLW